MYLPYNCSEKTTWDQVFWDNSLTISIMSGAMNFEAYNLPCSVRLTCAESLLNFSFLLKNLVG